MQMLSRLLGPTLSSLDPVQRRENKRSFVARERRDGDGIVDPDAVALAGQRAVIVPRQRGVRDCKWNSRNLTCIL